MDYALIRPMFGGKLKQPQVDGIGAILAVIEGLPQSYQAYMLATAFHETAATMQPIREYGRGKGRNYGRPGRNRGQVPYGRGYVQLTWDENYERADRELGLHGRLISDYELALRPDIAAQIMRRGMVEGWFTGRKLADYLPGDYVNARRIINGLDKSSQIAGYARLFEAAL